MSKKQPEENREYTQGEQVGGLLSRRFRAFTTRSREPGDAATWAVVLGSFMWTMLIICLSVAEHLLTALIMFVLTFVWIGIMSRFGKVNVAAILWGSATTDADRDPVEPVVFQSTLVVALISLVAVVDDAIRGWDFGWFGVVLTITVIVYLAIYVQAWLQPTRQSQ